MIKKTIIASLSLVLFISLQAQGELDSIKRIYHESDILEKRIDAINRWAYYVRDSNPDSTIILASIGDSLSVISNYKEGIGNAKMVRAMAYDKMGDFYLSLQYYLQAKEIYEELGMQKQLAACLNNIAILYSTLEDYDKAIDHYKEIAGFQVELRDSIRYALTLNNIGHTYKLKGNYENAMPPLYESLRIIRELKETRYEGFPIYNLGSVYMYLNKLDSSYEYLNKAIELGKLYENSYILSLSLIDLGKFKINMRDYPEAERLLLDAVEIAEEAGMRSQQRAAANCLAEIYDSQSKSDLALKYYKMTLELSNSILDRETTKNIAFLQAKYEFSQEEAEKEIERKATEMEREREAQKLRWIQYTLFGGLTLSSLIAYLFFLNLTRNRKANIKLKALNEEIRRQSEQLEQANKEIILVNANLEKVVNARTLELKEKNRKLREYLSANSHIVRAPVARILGLVDLYEEEVQEQHKFIKENIYASAKELDKVLRDLNDKLSSEEE